ncbi:TPA: type 1 fimbrial protein [Enterobacter asburiae]|uniref:fimbrial protein n=1 Tax=Enterobacter TaxID=547 RepID=UPI000D67C371|nr:MULTISPECIES: fimbrial protein [Enterobacter]MCF1342130.1 type 1 fimbrial protein [Enterobacter asburiae]MCM6998500.1 type 1 fimbrial protein [Enterobacter asburiae]MCQ4340508.1 type 1 fimbrial protein [Enterobacter asburiae]PWI77878.1 type 1 fimbrial protein [Enterobacter sp. CGMCC 5087]HDC4530675.1 type 1 fimbrial protein [Enterobacter asburiae]
MKTLLTVLLIGLTCQSLADEIQLDIRGNIYANACQVDSASQNLTIDLGQANVSDFKGVGDTGMWKSFDITLSKCPTTAVLASATFHGQSDSAYPITFANTGTAKGLALELAAPQDQIMIAPGVSVNRVINQQEHTVDFPLAARYYTTSVPVTAGTFSSVVQVTFTYQ